MGWTYLNHSLWSLFEPLPLVVISLREIMLRAFENYRGCHFASLHCCRKLQPHYVSLGHIPDDVTNNIWRIKGVNMENKLFHISPYLLTALYFIHDKVLGVKGEIQWFSPWFLHPFSLFRFLIPNLQSTAPCVLA